MCFPEIRLLELRVLTSSESTDGQPTQLLNWVMTPWLLLQLGRLSPYQVG